MRKTLVARVQTITLKNTDIGLEVGGRDQDALMLSDSQRMHESSSLGKSSDGLSSISFDKLFQRLLLFFFFFLIFFYILFFLPRNALVQR